MSKITSAQLRKIYALAKARGLDCDTLHAHIYAVTKKESIKELSVMQAVKVIDSLEGIDTNRISNRQKDYILSLAKTLNWVNDDKSVNIETVAGFIEGQTGIKEINWLTKKQASKILEAMKAIAERDKLKTNDNK